MLSSIGCFALADWVYLTKVPRYSQTPSVAAILTLGLLPVN